MGSTVVRDQDEDRLPAEGGGVRRTGTPGRGVQNGPLTTWSCRSRAIMTCSGLLISVPCADETFLIIILCDRASGSAAGSLTPCPRMGHVISCRLPWFSLVLVSSLHAARSTDCAHNLLDFT